MLTDRAPRSTPGPIMRAKAAAAAGEAWQSAAQARIPTTAITGAVAIGAEQPWVRLQSSDGRLCELRERGLGEMLRWKCSEV